MTEKIIVCYLFTKFDNENTLSNFIKNYKKFKSGLDHKLLICFKLLDEKKINFLSKHLLGIKHNLFIDNSTNNDFDLGSYKRISKKYLSNTIFFLNSHSYPICDYWLSKIAQYQQLNTIIGTSASNESLLSSLKLKKFYKVFSFIYKKFYLKKKFFPFPNPHLRTTGFMIKGSDFYTYIKDKQIFSKLDAWEIESGKKSLTNYFRNKDYNILLVNSDGACFNEKDWLYSETYNYLNQTKCIISDKHSRKYSNLDDDQKKIYQFQTWGL
mgnify:FL=1